jgi:hypothetical protein
MYADYVARSPITPHPLRIAPEVREASARYPESKTTRPTTLVTRPTTLIIYLRGLYYITWVYCDGRRVNARPCPLPPN